MKTQKLFMDSDVDAQHYASKDRYLYLFCSFVIAWFVGGALYSHYFLTQITMK